MPFLLRCIFIFILSASDLSAALADPFDKARNSIVYIYFDVTSENGNKISVSGTGFIVSSVGHVVTAAHLFHDWSKQNPVDKKKNGIWASLRDKPGNVIESPLRLDDIDLGNPDGEDVALLKLPSHGYEAYSAPPLCLTSRPKRGDEFFAYGFPGDQGFDFVRGRFGNIDGPKGRWTAEADFAPGMSGGPVYDMSGYVIGLVKGGLADIKTVRWITPISYAEHFLRMAQVVSRCDSDGWAVSLEDRRAVVNPPFKTKLIEELLIRATDGHGHAIRNPFIEVISGSNIIYRGYGDTDGYVHFNFNSKDYLARR
jgi:S1-C subfamily serine protease